MSSTASDPAEIAGLVTQLQRLKASDIHDEETRKSLFEAARNVAFALESPGDSIQRIAYIVWPPCPMRCTYVEADYHAPTQSLQTTAARIASDLKLFEILSEKEGSAFSTKQLAETTEADQVLLGK